MKHYLNGIEISPRNIHEIGFKSTWSDNVSVNDKGDRELSLNVDSVILPNEGKEIIQNWITQKGVFEGIPYDIHMNNGTVLKYYIDLIDGAKYRERDVTVKIKKRKAYDNFYQLARDTSFDLFKVKGVSYNIFDIPYVIIPQNQVELGITVSISVFVMSDALIKQIQKLSELTAESITALIPLIGAGIVINIGAISLIIIKLTLQIAYTIALIIALKKLLDQLRELIFPKVRNFKGCKVKDLLSQSCAYYGYGFQSTLLDSIDGLTILPVPLVKGKRKGFKSVFDYIQNDLNYAFTKGYPTGQDSTPTLWILIEEMEKTFNAKCKVINGVVRLERIDYWKNTTTTALLPSLTLQDTRQDEYEFNTFDAWRRYYIHLQPDYADQFTLDNYDNVDNEQSTEPLNVSNANRDIICVKGLNDRSINFAQGSRKSKLNWLEKRVRDLFTLVDKIANTSYANQINNRVGVLTISNQFYGITKLLYTVNGKQPANYLDYVGAKGLWTKYHYINQIQLNGYKIKENVKCLMNEELFVNLLTNNWVLIDGKRCEILSLEYKENDSQAIITFREPFDYSTGKVKTIEIDG